MKTENELSRDIQNVTQIIGDKYPELSKYLNEMPTRPFGTLTDVEEIEGLADYFSTLTSLLASYGVSHLHENQKLISKR
jgi:hypothetical protein